MPKNLQDSEKSTTFALANEKYRGVEQLVARQAHNLEVACSSLASATKKCRNSPSIQTVTVFCLKQGQTRIFIYTCVLREQT